MAASVSIVLTALNFSQLQEWLKIKKEPTNLMPAEPYQEH